MRLITIGDPHLNVTNNDGTTSKNRLTTIKNFVNQSNAKLCVVMGDNTDNASDTEFTDVKNIINSINSSISKFITIGNHDLTTTGSTGKNKFESYFGPSRRRVVIPDTINGVTTNYQLLFIGIYALTDDLGNIHFYWDFDFNSITNTQKTMHTLIFLHGPLIPPPISCTCCNWTDGYYFGYPMANPYDIKNELNKFTKIRAIYTGHVHYMTNQIVDILDSNNNGSRNVRHITHGAEIDRSLGQCDINPTRKPTNYVGYTKITPTIFQFTFLNYNNTFTDPYPDCNNPTFDFTL